MQMSGTPGTSRDTPPAARPGSGKTNAGADEISTVLALVRSQLDVSLGRLLRESVA